MRFLLFHEMTHLLFTSLLAFFLYRRFKNWKLVLSAFFVAIFLDIDHLFDYFFYAFSTGNFSFLLATDYFHGSKKVFVFLHGWEWSLPLWVMTSKIGKIMKVDNLQWAVVPSFLGHLFIDQLSYSPHPLGYFLVFRILTGFDLQTFNGL